MTVTVKVSGLPQSATESSVSDYFARAGEVTKVTLKENGTAEVELEREEDLEAALKLNDSEFEENVRINVSSIGGEVAPNRSHSRSQSRSKSPAGGEEDHRDVNTVVVLHLPTGMREPEIRTFFAACGEIKRVFVDRRAQKYAFVSFAEEAGMEAALKLHDTEWSGHKMEIEQRKPKNSAAKSFRVVFSELAEGTTEAQVREVAETAGPLSDFFLNANRHLVYLSYTNAEDMEKGLKLDGTEINGAKVTVKEREAKKCFKCGKEGHIGAQCRSVNRDIECHNCGRRGHIARECRQPRREGGGRGGGRRGGDFGGRGRVDRRRRRSDSYDRDRDYRRRRYSRSRSPPRRRYSRSRSPPRRYRRSRSYTPSRSRSPPRRR